MRWAGRLPAHERQKQILRPAYPTHNEVVHGAPAVRVLRMTRLWAAEI
jgi:hypothetical protein